MLRAALVIAAVATCTSRAPVASSHADEGQRTGPPRPPSAIRSSAIWSSAIGEGRAARSVGRWLATRSDPRDAVLVVLRAGALHFVDARGRRLAEVPVPGYDAAALDATRGVVWLGGGRRVAAIDLLADDARVTVLARDLPHEGYAVQRSSAPVPNPDLFVGVDAHDEPGSAYMLLDWSAAAPSLASLVVGDDGDAVTGPLAGRWDARWLEARAERVVWPAIRSQLTGRHPSCPVPHGDLDCQPFGGGDLWLVAVDEEQGDVLHVDALLYDAARRRWAAPRDDVAPPALVWSDAEPPGVELSVDFDRNGRAYTTTTHVCEVDGGCQALDGEPLGFLGGGVRLGTSS